MISRKFNNINVTTSLLGFGCMRFPQLKNNKVNIPLAEEMIKYAIDHGVNYFDTALIYHDGESEKILKDILVSKYPRDSYYLADKLPLWVCKDPSDVPKVIDEQLEKAGVEYFDFYLLHAMSQERLDTVIKWDVMSILEEYKKQGKIKHIGFSFHDDLKAFTNIVNYYNWDFAQIQLNYMDLDNQQGIEGYNLLVKKNIPCIIMEPIKGGSLSKFKPEIEQIFKDYNPTASISSWALRYIASFDNVKVVLSGMSSMEHVIDNINTFSNFKPVNSEEKSIISEITTKLTSLTKVGCTSCGYCMPCPAGVDIPRNFSIYNTHAMYENIKETEWLVSNLYKEGFQSDLCVNCGKCVLVCPQHINIPEELENITKFYKEFKS